MPAEPEQASWRRDGTPPATARRRAARLNAVQALYQVSLSNADPRMALEDQASYRQLDGEEFVQPERDLFRAIVLGVADRRVDLDDMIAGSLTKVGGVDRLDVVLRAIMQAGAWELMSRPQTDAGVILNDYIDITHSFYEGQESRLVNAVLDRLAKVLRPAGQ